MKKKILSVLLCATMFASVLTGCNGTTDNGTVDTGAVDNSVVEDSVAEEPAASEEVTNDLAGTTINVAAIETAYGAEMWQKVAEAFTAEAIINVELTTDKNLEDVIGPSMQGGEYPDVIHLGYRT